MIFRKIKSLNIVYFVVFGIIVSIILIAKMPIFFPFYNSHNGLLWLIIAIILYIMGCLLIRFVIIDEDRFVIFYPLRFISNKKIITHEDILKMKIVVPSLSSIIVVLKVKDRFLPFRFRLSVFVNRNCLKLLIEQMKRKNIFIVIDGKL